MIFDGHLESILEKITLLGFDRKRFGGGVQEFYFHIEYENKDYLLIHNFTYHNTGVTHLFKFKKSFFKPKPFILTHNGYIQLSNSLMKRVNAMNQVS